MSKTSPPTPPDRIGVARPRRRECFLRQLGWDIQLWLFGMTTLIVARVGFIIALWGELDDGVTVTDLLAVAERGIRFDLAVAGLLALPGLVFLSIPIALGNLSATGRSVRRWWAWTFWTLTGLVTVVAVGYYLEYHDLFNHSLFGLVYDDVVAILRTIAREYALAEAVAVILLVAAGGILLTRFWFIRPWFDLSRLPGRYGPPWLRMTVHGSVLVVLALALIFIFRGSWDRVPLQERHAEVTRHALLNKAVLGNLRALHEAVKLESELSGEEGLRRFHAGDPAELTARLFPDQPARSRLDDYLRRQAAGRSLPVRHIFVIVAEGYSAWPLREPYRRLPLTPGLQRLQAQGGVLLDRILPASDGTMNSLATLVTGLPDAGLTTNYRPSAQRPFATSLPSQFRRLGWITRFYYGGSGTWQRLADFVRDQGVTDVHTAIRIRRLWQNQVWGLPDHELFDYILRTFEPEQPSLNIILTVSNHPPYTIDLAGAGIDAGALERDLRRVYPDSSAGMAAFAHFRYADEALAAFVAEAARRFPGALFVVTGDHCARNLHLLHRPPLLDMHTVPLFFYGEPAVMAGLALNPETFGTQLDLIPTLIERAAPSGFEYYALGRDLGGERPAVVFNRDCVLGPDFVARIDALPRAEDVQGHPLILDRSAADRMRRQHGLVTGFSWLRIMSVDGEWPAKMIAR
ncbi:MAG: sulfatase-like hydrolase/transferase [Acidobacteria bacterium]|nr:sulfatase-like hydrolase/transferase [Acidobacteriota bacterium]